MAIHDLGHKLDPARYPNMSPQMGAILGYLFERVYTTPALAELTVTPDGPSSVGPKSRVRSATRSTWAVKPICVPI